MGVVLSLVGAIAIILIIISGYRLMVSQGNPENIKNAREQLTAAIVGLLFVIFSLVILQVIGVNILGLPGISP
jgi:glucose uptake protein GlcU